MLVKRWTAGGHRAIDRLVQHHQRAARVGREAEQRLGPAQHAAARHAIVGDDLVQVAAGLEPFARVVLGGLRR